MQVFEYQFVLEHLFTETENNTDDVLCLFIIIYAWLLKKKQRPCCTFFALFLYQCLDGFVSPAQA